MQEITSMCWMIITALLWGVTDPMMKLYGKNTLTEENKNHDAESRTTENGLIFKTLKLFKRWKFLLSFLLNQLGR